MFVRACPRPMHNVLCAGTIEARALWIRTRESGISLRRWRRLCHGGPPVVRNGPKDTDLTPVAPRYCSPGLPKAGWVHICEKLSDLLSVLGCAPCFLRCFALSVGHRGEQLLRFHLTHHLLGRLLERALYGVQLLDDRREPVVQTAR